MTTFKTRIGEVRIPVAEDYERLSIEINEAGQVNVTHHEGIITVVEEIFRRHRDKSVGASAGPAVSEPLARLREGSGEGIEQVGVEELRDSHYGAAADNGLESLVAIIAGQKVIAMGDHHHAALEIVDRRSGEDLYPQGVGQVGSEPVIMIAAGDEDFRTASGKPSDRIEDITVICRDDAAVLEPEIEYVSDEIETRGACYRQQEITEKGTLCAFKRVLFRILEMCVGQKVYCITQVLLSPRIDWVRRIYVRVAVKFQDFLTPARPVKEAR